MMLKGRSLSRMLLLVLWSTKVCLATDRREGGGYQYVFSGEGRVSLGMEQYGEEAAQTLALFVIEECENGLKGVCDCLLDFVRSRSLEPWFAKVAEGFKEWEGELEKFVEVPRIRAYGYNLSGCPRKTPGRPKYIPTFPELDNYCKRAYNSCISSFKEALAQFHCCMEPEDFFPDLGDTKEKIAERSLDLDSLRESIEWNHNDTVELHCEYVSKSLEVSAQALKIRKDLLEHMEEDPGWKFLMDQKKEILANSPDQGFIRLISENRREINALMLTHLTECDKERWKILIESVGPVLKYGPLTNDRDGNYFDGFDDLVIYIVKYVKERRIADFWKNRGVLFEKDLDFSRSLNEKMESVLSKNVLTRKGIRIPEAGDDGRFYN